MRLISIIGKSDSSNYYHQQRNVVNSDRLKACQLAVVTQISGLAAVAAVAKIDKLG